MDERLKFIARLLDDDKMSVLCRKSAYPTTSYKILKRYNDCGLHGLTDRSPSSRLVVLSVALMEQLS